MATAKLINGNYVIYEIDYYNNVILFTDWGYDLDQNECEKIQNVILNQTSSK